MKIFAGLRFFNPFRFIFVKGCGGAGGSPPVVPDKLLLEDSSDLLLESGDKILLE